MFGDIEEKNAIITGASITNDDHGLLSAWLYLEYGGGGQAFGGFALYLPDTFKHHKDSNNVNYAGHFIWRVMEIAEVTKWDNLKGKTIRVRARHDNVEAIGHIVRDIWFNPSEEFKILEEQNKPLAES